MTDSCIRSTLALCVALTALAGCGDDPADSQESFESAYATKLCEQWFRCQDSYEGDGDANAERAGYTQVQCAADENEPLSATMQAYIDAGTVRYDAAAGKACLASFSDICAGGRVGACDDVLVGTVAVGGSCSSSVQCASSSCSATAEQCGMCLETVADGEPCTAATHCRPGSYCSTTTGTCNSEYSYEETHQVGLDERCGESETGDVYTACDAGLYCSETTERCAERIAVGLRCDSDEDSCAFGTFCLEDELEVERCTAITVTTVVGGDCGETSTGFAVCDSSQDLYCDFDDDVSGSCVRFTTTRKLGDECRDANDCDSERCAYVSGEGEICVAGDLALGATCSDGAQCVTGYCDFVGPGGVCAEVSVCK